MFYSKKYLYFDSVNKGAFNTSSSLPFYIKEKNMVTLKRGEKRGEKTFKHLAIILFFRG